jgi:hypothetical protein
LLEQIQEMDQSSHMVDNYGKKMLQPCLLTAAQIIERLATPVAASHYTVPKRNRHRFEFYQRFGPQCRQIGGSFFV